MAPLLPIAIALIAGILIEGVLPSAWWAVLPLTTSLVLLLLKYSYPAILSLCVVAGYFISESSRPATLLPHMYAKSAVWSGCVTESREYEGARMLIVDIDSCGYKPLGHSTLTKCLVPSLIPYVDESDRIIFRSALQPLTHSTDIPDEIDYNANMSRMGVTAETMIISDSILNVLPEHGLLHDIRRLRHRVHHSIAMLPITESTKSFLIATLTGDRTWLTTDSRELYSVTGIAHVLALSGLHVGILTILLTLLLLPLNGIKGGRYIRITVITLLLWSFAILTGLSTSVVRAVIMATLMAICMTTQRVWTPLNALSAAAIIILLFSPHQVHSLGFILSFTSVLSIIIFADRINPFSYRHNILRHLSGYICAAIAAMLGSGIVCAHYFHLFPTYFILTNIVVSLLMPPLLGGAVVMLVLHWIGFDTTFLGYVIDRLYSIVERTALFVSELPGAIMSDLYISADTMAAYFTALIFFAIWLYRRRVAYLYASGLSVIFTIIISFVGNNRQYPINEVYITGTSNETSVIIKNGNKLYAHNTAKESRNEELIDRDAKRYSHYMHKRGIKSLSSLRVNTCGDTLSLTDNIITFLGKSFVFITDDRDLHEYNVKPDYAVICRGFRGDVCKLAKEVKADSIFLSRDLNRIRHDRYSRELTEEGVAYRSLRDKAFHMVIK